MTDASRDEKLQALVAEHGPIAYARYWRVIETIAEKMKDNGDPEITLPLSSWSRILWTKGRQQAADILLAFGLHRLCIVDVNGMQARCECANIRKLKEWTHKKAPNTSATEEEKELRIRTPPTPSLDKPVDNSPAKPAGVLKTPPVCKEHTSSERHRLIGEYFKARGRASWTETEARDAWVEIKASWAPGMTASLQNPAAIEFRGGRGRER